MADPRKGFSKPTNTNELASTPSQIGANLQAVREKAGREQEGVAREIGIHPQTLSKYERGVIKKVPSAVVSKLAALYGVSSDDLLSGNVSAMSQKAVREAGVRYAEPNSGYKHLTQSLRILAAEFELEAEKRGAPEWAMDHFRYSLRNPDATRMFRFGQDGRVLSSDEQITAMRQHIMKLRALLDGIVEEMRAAHDAGTDRPGPGDGSPI